MNKSCFLWFAVMFACTSGTNPSGPSHEAEGEAEGANDCDDGLDCTEDRDMDGECQHYLLHARCPQGQICDSADGCVTPLACKNVGDCPDLGRCSARSCDASCHYANMDQDGDGYVSRECGGDDCFDDPGSDGPGSIMAGAIHPDADESCNGVDDNCNGQVDEGLLTPQPCEEDGLCGVQTCTDGKEPCVSPSCDPIAQTGCAPGNACYIIGADETTGAITGCACEAGTGQQYDACDLFGPDPIPNAACAPGYTCSPLARACMKICHRGSTDECPEGTACDVTWIGTLDQPFYFCRQL